MLQIAALCVRSNDFNELEIVVLRHELAVLRRTRLVVRPALPHGSQPAPAARTLAVLLHHTGDVAGLAKGTAADSYVVTDVEGTGPKSIGIISSTANLAPHISHKITVTGTALPVKDAGGMSPAPPKAPDYMEITAVKMVSAPCP